MVVTALRQRARSCFGDLQVAPAKQVRDSPVVDTPEFHDQAGISGAAPLDLPLGAPEPPAPPGLESTLEVCQGNPLDRTVQAIRPRHLPDPDHARAPPLE